MKPIVIILLSTITLGFVSCKKETIVEKETIIQELSAKTYNFTIRSTDWRKNSDGSFFVSKSISAIDAITIEDEGVLVYFQHPADVNGDIQLPYVYNYSAYSYKIINGGLRFDVQHVNNLSLSVAPNYDTLVKVVIIPSKYAEL